jgi:hypothetical protein
MMPGRTVSGVPGQTRGVLHGLGDLRPERAAVEIVGALCGQLLVRLGQVGVLQRRTDGQRLALGSEEQLAAAGERLQVGQRDLFFLHEVGGDREAVPGDADRRLQVLGEAVFAVPAHRRRPGGDHARHAHRQPGVAGLFERQRRAGCGVDEQVRGARCGAHLPSVDRHHLMRLRQVDDHESAAAWPSDERLGNAKRARHRHGCVDRVAARAQHVDTRLAGVKFARGDRATGAHGNRLLDVGRRLPRGRGDRDE